MISINVKTLALSNVNDNWTLKIFNVECHASAKEIPSTLAYCDSFQSVSSRNMTHKERAIMPF